MSLFIILLSIILSILYYCQLYKTNRWHAFFHVKYYYFYVKYSNTRVQTNLGQHLKQQKTETVLFTISTVLFIWWSPLTWPIKIFNSHLKKHINQ